jgi:hypothetical protein
MAQATSLSIAYRPPLTGANVRRPAQPVRTAQAHSVTALAKHRPWPIPLFADATAIVYEQLSELASDVSGSLQEAADALPRSAT